MPVTYAIAWPRSHNGQVSVDDVRLIITDVPDDATKDEVLAWLDDQSDFDHAIPEDEWGPGIQMRAENAPRVKWRGRPGRPKVGTPINVRLDDETLAALDAEAQRADESRAAAIRRLLAAALHGA